VRLDGRENGGHPREDQQTRPRLFPSGCPSLCRRYRPPQRYGRHERDWRPRPRPRPYQVRKGTHRALHSLSQMETRSTPECTPVGRGRGQDRRIWAPVNTALTDSYFSSLASAPRSVRSVAVLVARCACSSNGQHRAGARAARARPRGPGGRGARVRSHAPAGVDPHVRAMAEGWPRADQQAWTLILQWGNAASSLAALAPRSARLPSTCKSSF